MAPAALLAARVLSCGGAALFWALPLAGGLSVAGLSSAHGTERSVSFERFVELNGRSYVPGTSEYLERARLYAAAAERVDSHNQKPDRSWTASVGKFADYTAEEKRERLHGLVRDPADSSAPGPPAGGAGRSTVNLATRRTTFPRSFSWEHLHAFKRVKNQGHCGSCWASSALKTLEAHYEIFSNKTVTLSVQHLVSCAANPRHCGGTGGCHGATSDIAFQYVLEHGIATEEQYPYRQQEEACPSSMGTVAMRAELGMLSWERLPENKYEALVHALVEVGPVVVSVAATSGEGDLGIDSYGGGVYDFCKQDAVLNHAMVLFGFGQEERATSDAYRKVGYWHLQNSWGADWGEDGNMRLLRRLEGEEFWCGDDDQPLKGSGCPGGPGAIRVCGSCGILYKGTLPHLAAAAATATPTATAPAATQPPRAAALAGRDAEPRRAVAAEPRWRRLRRFWPWR